MFFACSAVLSGLHTRAVPSSPCVSVCLSAARSAGRRGSSGKRQAPEKSGLLASHTFEASAWNQAAHVARLEDRTPQTLRLSGNSEPVRSCARRTGRSPSKVTGYQVFYAPTDPSPVLQQKTVENKVKHGSRTHRTYKTVSWTKEWKVCALETLPRCWEKPEPRRL